MFFVGFEKWLTELVSGETPMIDLPLAITTNIAAVEHANVGEWVGRSMRTSLSQTRI